MDKINPFKLNPWEENYTGYMFKGVVSAALCRKGEKIWFEKDGRELCCSTYPSSVIAGCEYVKMEKLIDLKVDMEVDKGTYNLAVLQEGVYSVFDLFNTLKAEEFKR